MQGSLIGKMQIVKYQDGLASACTQGSDQVHQRPVDGRPLLFQTAPCQLIRSSTPQHDHQAAYQLSSFVALESIQIVQATVQPGNHAIVVLKICDRAPGLDQAREIGVWNSGQGRDFQMKNRNLLVGVSSSKLINLILTDKLSQQSGLPHSGFRFQMQQLETRSRVQGLPQELQFLFPAQKRRGRQTARPRVR